MTKDPLNKRSFLKASISIGVLTTFPSIAFAKTVKRFSQNKKKQALKGYDTTAYFQSGKPVNGKSETTVKWKGAVWRFASQEDANLFRADPEAYAPQFGGYCTRAMSLGREVPGNPKVWRIHKGKLHVFFAKQGGVFFDKGEDAMIKKAQAHWDTLKFAE